MRTQILFEDRWDAGDQLADALKQYRTMNPVVLGIPRGGIPVAAPVAERLGGELDVIVVKKMGAPGNSELAIGAVGESGSPYLNDELVDTLQIDRDYLVKETTRQHQSAKILAEEFRLVRQKADPEDRTVILVDDGIATGATIRACLEIIRQEKPKTLFLGIPVAPLSVIEELRSNAPVETVVCLHAIEGFFGGIGGYYRDFGQVSSESVREALKHYAPSD